MAMFFPPSLLDKDCWILDSGATHHMTNILGGVLSPSEVKDIRLGNSNMLPVVGKKNISLEDLKLELRDVLCVPELSVNLISISCLLDSGCDIVFQNESNTCKITKDERVIGTAERRNNLWYLNVVIPEAQVNMSQGLDKSKLWHLRLNHLNLQSLQKLATSGKYPQLSNIQSSDSHKCIGCALGKQHRLPYTSSLKDWNTEPLELVHTDLVGPISVPAVGQEGRKYLLTIVDDSTRKSSIYFLQQKSEVPHTLAKWKNLVENQSRNKVKTIRSDNGGEFLNKHLNQMLMENGISQELTIPYSPEQNGVAERFHRTLFDAVRAMLFGGRILAKFWWEAVKCFNYTNNRIPKGKAGEIPEEVWRKKKLTIDHLRIFGTPVTVHIPDEINTKLNAKSWAGIFLGYAAARKGFRIWNPNTEEIKEARNVSFYKERLMDSHFSFPWEH